MSHLRTAFQIPTEPWERAKNEFTKDLTPEEKRTFDNATIENVFYDASVNQKVYAQNSKTWKMHEKLRPFLETVEGFGKAIDVYANASSTVLSPLWGSIRVVLLVATTCGDYQLNLTKMFARIGDVLPRLKTYQALFPTYEALLVILSRAFIIILEFCTDAKRVIRKAQRARYKPLAARALWKPFLNRFDKYISDFRACTKEIEKQAYNAHMIEAARAQEEERNERALREHRTRASRHRQALHQLSSVDHERKHAKVLKERHPGSGAWIFDDNIFHNWYLQSRSNGFVIFGIPGCGKTTLLGGIIHTWKESHADRNAAVIFHYCDFAEHASLEPLAIVRSLFRQVLEKIGPEDTVEEVLQLSDNEVLLNDEKRLLETLKRTLLRLDQVFIVIDGLDELPISAQEFVCTLAASLLATPHICTKVLLSSRGEEPHIRRHLVHFPDLNLSRDLIGSDIAVYVLNTIEHKIQTGRLELQSQSLKAEIVETLILKADNMFLWVRFQIDDLCEAMNDEQIRQTLRSLPKDLSETYARILTKIWKSTKGPDKMKMASRVLKWVVCARRPLQLEETQELVSLETTDEHLHFDRIPTNGERLVSACGNLVILDRDENSINIAHHTVHQFLCSKPPAGILYPEEVHFDFEQADSQIGELCVTYLSFADFETQIVDRPKDTTGPISESLVSSILWNGIPFRSLFTNVMSHLTRSSSSSANLKMRFPPRQRLRVPPEALKRRYSALDYVSNYWPFHVSSFTTSFPCWNKFVNLAIEKQLLFRFRIWEPVDALDQSQDAQWERLLDWAIENDVVSFLEIIDKSGFDTVHYLWKTFQDHDGCFLRAVQWTSDRRIDERLLAMLQSEINGNLYWDGFSHASMTFYGAIVGLSAKVSPDAYGRTFQDLLKNRRIRREDLSRIISQTVLMFSAVNTKILESILQSGSPVGAWQPSPAVFAKFLSMLSERFPGLPKHELNSTNYPSWQISQTLRGLLDRNSTQIAFWMAGYLFGENFEGVLKCARYTLLFPCFFTDKSSGIITLRQTSFHHAVAVAEFMVQKSVTPRYVSDQSELEAVGSIMGWPTELFGILEMVVKLIRSIGPFVRYPELKRHDFHRMLAVVSQCTSQLHETERSDILRRVGLQSLMTTAISLEHTDTVLQLLPLWMLFYSERHFPRALATTFEFGLKRTSRDMAVKVIRGWAQDQEQDQELWGRIREAIQIQDMIRIPSSDFWECVLMAVQLRDPLWPSLQVSEESVQERERNANLDSLGRWRGAVQERKPTPNSELWERVREAVHSRDKWSPETR